MKKVLKIFGIILLVIIVILLIHTIRNFIIVRDLQDKIEKYKESASYHIKIVTKEPNNIEMIANYYKKDEKQATIITRNINGVEDTKISKYGNNTYIERGTTKIATIGTDGVSLAISIYNGVESDSTWHTILSSIVAFVGSEKVNGKDCYVVNNFPSFVNLMFEGTNKYYIEKETGLLIKSITNDIISEREYDFNYIDDSVFVEPDISEYTIQ